jgi:CBS domain-containing protein
MRTVQDLLEGKGRDIWSIGPKATVYEALRIMGEKDIGALAVIDEGKIVGIVSERDYARKVALRGKTARETGVADIMSPVSEMVAVRPDTPVEECMVLITGKKIRHLPVFDGGSFVGMISIGDVLKSVISEQVSVIEQLSNYIAGKYV